MLSGGPLSWLIFGLEKVDRKLARIALLNEKLAYRPWSIGKEDFQFLTKEGDQPAHNWQIQEVIKASIILSTYHGLCGLCHGMGVVADKDIISELVSIVGPQSITALLSEETFRENDEDNFISLQMGANFSQKVGELMRQNSSGIIKSARSDRSSQKGGDLRSERIFDILK